MKIADMTVGTMYYVNSRQNWQEDSWGAQAYILVSIQPYTERKYHTFSGNRHDVTTVDGVEYAYHGREWSARSDSTASRKYLMVKVDPETREPLDGEREGRPYAHLVTSAAVRGEWVETLEMVQEAEAEALEVRQAAAQARERRDNLGASVAARLRGILGRNIDARYDSGCRYGARDTIELNPAQGRELIEKIEALEAEVARLRAIANHRG